MDYLKEPGGDEKRKTGVGISYNSFDWNETDKDDDIETEVKEEKFSLKKSRVIKKKMYMITPCDHVFHTVCLERWMMLKNDCPYCKRKIPPVE